MKEFSAEILSNAAAEKSWTAVFSDLVKARLTTLVLLTTAVGFYVGEIGAINWFLFFNTLAATGLVALVDQTYSSAPQSRSASASGDANHSVSAVKADTLEEKTTHAGCPSSLSSSSFPTHGLKDEGTTW